MKRYSICVLALVFFAACAKRGQEPKEMPLQVRVERGPRNQPSLKVDGKTKAGKESEADNLLFEKQGYVVAFDRFLQMDLLRRRCQGRLAELLGGVKAQEADSLTMGVGLLDAVEGSTQKLQFEHPEVYEQVEAFARGVNQFIIEAPTLKPELIRQYRALTRDPNFQISAWTAQDSIGIATSLTFYLSSALPEKLSWGMIERLLRLQDAEHWMETFNQILDLRPIENDVIVNKPFTPLSGRPTAAVQPKLKKKTKTRLTKNQKRKGRELIATWNYQCEDQGFPMPECGRKAGFGSNNWAVSKQFAGGNATFIANDTHLPITFPMAFYEVALDSKSAGGTIRARGLTPPGVPGILIGHNDFFGWALTNLQADVDDLYVEQLDSNYLRTTHKGRLEPLKIVRRKLMVRGADGQVRERKEPVVIKYAEGHGPLFSEHMPKLDDIIKKVEKNGFMGSNLALSYKWVGHGGSTEMAAILGINRASDFNGFKAALANFKVGAQNFVYGDRDGNIGYFGHSNYPIRKYVSEEKYPPYIFVRETDGHTREWEPNFREVMPEVYRQDGFIVSANNDPLGHSLNPQLSNFEDYFGFTFSDGIRAHRIAELLREKKVQKGVLTADDMQAIQLDVKDGLAIHFIDLLEKSGVREQLDEKGRAFVDSMLAWRQAGTFATRDRREPVAFYEWAKLLSKDFLSFKETKPDEVEEPVAEAEAEVAGAENDRWRFWNDAKKRVKTAFVQATQAELVKNWDEITDKLYRTSPAVKTIYHRLADSLEVKDSPEFKNTATLFVRTIERAVTNMAKNGKENLRWGQINRMVFANPMKEILPQFLSLSLERDGSIETVSPSEEGFGPNFRLVMTLEAGKPIEARISVPGGNYGPFETDSILKELEMWRDGGQRDLINFI